MGKEQPFLFFLWVSSAVVFLFFGRIDGFFFMDVCIYFSVRQLNSMPFRGWLVQIVLVQD